jgi:hypothetical protein
VSLRPYKFQIVAVCQDVEDGAVVGEQVVTGTDGQPIVVFGLAGLRLFADGFEDQLKASTARDA